MGDRRSVQNKKKSFFKKRGERSRFTILTQYQDLDHGSLTRTSSLSLLGWKSCQFVWQSLPSDYSTEHLVHTDARHHFIPTNSQFLHPRSFWTPVTHSIQPHCSCFVARWFFAICSSLTGPILSVGHSVGVVTPVYGRTLGFFQRPRSSP